MQDNRLKLQGGRFFPNRLMLDSKRSSLCSSAANSGATPAFWPCKLFDATAIAFRILANSGLSVSAGLSSSSCSYNMPCGVDKWVWYLIKRAASSHVSPHFPTYAGLDTKDFELIFRHLNFLWNWTPVSAVCAWVVEPQKTTLKKIEYCITMLFEAENTKSQFQTFTRSGHPPALFDRKKNEVPYWLCFIEGPSQERIAKASILRLGSEGFSLEAS